MKRLTIPRAETPNVVQRWEMAKPAPICSTSTACRAGQGGSASRRWGPARSAPTCPPQHHSKPIPFQELSFVCVCVDSLVLIHVRKGEFGSDFGLFGSAFLLLERAILPCRSPGAGLFCSDSAVLPRRGQCYSARSAANSAILLDSARLCARPALMLSGAGVE